MNAQDVINALTEQRNAALNEVAMLKAQLAASKREAERNADTQRLFDEAADRRDMPSGAGVPL